MDWTLKQNYGIIIECMYVPYFLQRLPYNNALQTLWTGLYGCLWERKRGGGGGPEEQFVRDDKDKSDVMVRLYVVVKLAPCMWCRVKVYKRVKPNRQGQGKTCGIRIKRKWTGLAGLAAASCLHSVALCHAASATDENLHVCTYTLRIRSNLCVFIWSPAC